MSRPTRLFRGPFLLLLLAAGCRYTTDGGLPAHIRSIQVPVFRNRTTDRNLAPALTRAVQEHLAAAGRLRLAGSRADAVLEGEITRVTRRVSAEDAADTAIEAQFEITARVRLIDRTGSEPVVLFDRPFTNRGLYLEDGTIRTLLGESERSQRPLALRRLGDYIARAVLDYWPKKNDNNN